MKINIGEIRRLIDDALDDSEFQNLCQDYFSKVYRSFTTGQDRSQRIRQLVEYAERHREIHKLLKAIKQANPEVYAEFESKLVETPQSDEQQQQQNLNLEGSMSTNSDTCDILILSANPRGTDLLQLEKEAELIRLEFQNGQQRYTVRVERAVRVEELSRHLLKYEPIIVHFSGHGGPNGEIVLENEYGNEQPVAAEDFARLLSAAQSRIECVVLNTCFSMERADALAEHVACVIGMTKEFDDESALRFAAGFYRGLAFGKGYYTAFELGRSEIPLMGLPDGQVPHFFTQDTLLISAEAVKPRVTRSLALPTENGQQNATLYPLWFGTNRRPINSHDLSIGFSNERDNQIYYGTCQVVVPNSHKIGSTGSPWWQRLLTLKDDRLRLDRGRLNLLASANFWDHIRSAL